jgi:hypothetical protein
MFSKGFATSPERILSDTNQQFTVVGAVGRVSVGKSFILNAIHSAGEYAVYRGGDEVDEKAELVGKVFAECSDQQLVECSACTTGIEICVNSAHRTITVDTWPVFYGQEFDDAKLIVRYLAFMLCACDVICVVMDRVLDWNLWTTLRAARMLVQLWVSSPKVVSAASSSSFEKFTRAAKLLFVFNKEPANCVKGSAHSAEITRDLFPDSENVIIALDEPREAVSQKMNSKVFQLSRSKINQQLTEKNWAKELSFVWDTIQGFPLPE